MAASKANLLLFMATVCLLYTARCQENTDAAATFNATQPFPLLDDFANDGNAIQYGLSPNATSRLSYTGLGTVAYSQDPIPSSGAVSLGCGFGYVGVNFTSALVGVGSAFYQEGFSCGRCVMLQCDDTSCEEPGRQAVALIVDQCGECMDADLNIGYPLFEKISGRSPLANPTLSLSWQFTDCSPYIYNSTIKMLVKPGGNAYYQAFNFANSRQVITAVQMNGQLLKHETNHYWSWSPASGPINSRGPFDLALLGANRQVLRVRLPQLKSSDLGIQFAMPSGQPPAAEGKPAAAVPQAEEQPVATASSSTAGNREGPAASDNKP